MLNLPSADMVAAVNRLARLTGSNPVPEGKLRKGYRHEADKFGAAGLTGSPRRPWPPRATECPVQLEARVDAVHGLAADDDKWRGRLLSIEVRITRVHVDERCSSRASAIASIPIDGAR